MYKCTRTLCTACPYPYCIDGTEEGKEIAREYRKNQSEKSKDLRQKEAWKRWYERHKEAERKRSRENQRRRKIERCGSNNGHDMPDSDVYNHSRSDQEEVKA